MMMDQEQHRIYPDPITQRRYAIRSIVVVAIGMILIFSIGLRAYILVIHSAAGAFWPAVPMLLAVVFSFTGFSLHHFGKPLLIASVIFLCAAVFLSVIASISDGISAEEIHHIDHSLCYYATGHDFIPPCVDNATKMYNRYPKRSCSCCSSWMNAFISHSWNSVTSCDEVLTDFQNLLWTSVVLNILGVVVCVIAASCVLGYLSLISSHNGQQPQVAMPTVHYVPANLQSGNVTFSQIHSQPTSSLPQSVITDSVNHNESSKIHPTSPYASGGSFRGRSTGVASSKRNRVSDDFSMLKDGLLVDGIHIKNISNGN